MNKEGNLINKVKEKLEAIGKDEVWLAERMGLSEETQRAWMSGEQKIPDNKLQILEGFVCKDRGLTKPQGKPGQMLSADDIINSR